jgi:hypothetical protein
MSWVERNAKPNRLHSNPIAVSSSMSQGCQATVASPFGALPTIIVQKLRWVNPGDRHTLSVGDPICGTILALLKSAAPMLPDGTSGSVNEVLLRGPLGSDDPGALDSAQRRRGRDVHQALSIRRRATKTFRTLTANSREVKCNSGGRYYAHTAAAVVTTYRCLPIIFRRHRRTDRHFAIHSSLPIR